MNKLFRNILIIALFIIPAALSAQGNPVSWNYSVEKGIGDTLNVIFEASIDQGWHIYDMEVREGGPNPTLFTLEDNPDIEVVGPVEYLTEPVREMDETFGMEIGYFEKKALFCQRLIAGHKVDLSVNIEWMCCNEGNCIPPADIDMVIPLNPDGSPSPEAVESTASNEKGTDNSASGIWVLIIGAILWGFAALLTPCVFPMIPMTVSFFLKGSENKSEGRFRALMYGIFIVLLYTVPICLIIVVTRLVGGESVTADIFNFLSTHWIPNLLFFLVFMVFAASFFGAFELVLPSRIVNGSDKKSEGKGLGGVFFMALTLVLVSFSCTGPIVGSVLIKSTAGEFWTPMVTMLAFSITFALPFTLFALFPSWLKKLPRSGGWLNTVKVVLGFIEVALGFKFLSTADQTYQWGILDREVYLAIWIVCFAMLGFYLLGKLRFKNDEPLEYISITRLTLAIAVFSFVIYMIPGMWGAPLKAISGYLPPIQTQDFVLDKYEVAPQPIETGRISGFPEKIKYGDSGLRLPNNLQGFLDLKEAEAYSEKVGKPLFIDFTGLGCMNCREMEARVLSDPEIMEMLTHDYVVVSLFGDDKKTEVDPSDWITTDTGKTLKKLGKINSYIVLKEFGINAQPYYILKGHGRVLCEPRSYSLDIGKFREFLRTGLEEYAK